MQYQAYVETKKYLYPLRYRTAAEARDAIAALNKVSIASPAPGDVVFVDLQLFDVSGKEVSEWFDSLGLEDKVRTHVTRAECGKLAAGGKKIAVTLPVFGRVVRLSMFDVTTCVNALDEMDEDFVIVDDEFVNAHPEIRTLGAH